MSVCLPYSVNIGADRCSRYEQMQYPKLRAAKTGYDLYGCWECCYTCKIDVFPFLGLQLTLRIRLSQLIGSTLALEYMRAGVFQPRTAAPQY